MFVTNHRELTIEHNDTMFVWLIDLHMIIYIMYVLHGIANMHKHIYLFIDFFFLLE